MKKRWLIVCYVVLDAPVWACPVCDRNQPKILKGWIHAGGPNGILDYLPVIAMIILALIALYFSVKWLIKPGEKQDDHIKRTVLNNEPHE